MFISRGVCCSIARRMEIGKGGRRKRDNCYEEVFVCVEISVLQSS